MARAASANSHKVIRWLRCYQQIKAIANIIKIQVNEIFRITKAIIPTCAIFRDQTISYRVPTGAKDIKELPSSKAPKVLPVLFLQCKS